MQVTDTLIRNVVQEVLAHMKNGQGLSKDHVAGNGSTPKTQPGNAWGVFDNVDDAVRAATAAQLEFEKRGLEARRKAVACIRKICIDKAECLGLEELEETKIGRLKHKVEKLVTCAEKTLGVEFLRTDAFSGDYGVTVQEFAPFGVVGIITPVTHSLPTLAEQCHQHPRRRQRLGVQSASGRRQDRLPRARSFSTRPFTTPSASTTLLTIIAKPTLESAQAIFDHRDVRLLCVTGGPAVGRAALRSPKRAIVAGPGNPPVVVDETADLDNAAKCIVAGGATTTTFCASAKRRSSPWPRSSTS